MLTNDGSTSIDRSSELPVSLKIAILVIGHPLGSGSPHLIVTLVLVVATFSGALKLSGFKQA